MSKTNKSPLNIMKYLLIFQVLTIVFYFFGPITWQTKNPFLTFLLVFIYLFVLYFGYKIGEKKQCQISKERTENSSNLFIKYFYLFFIICFVVSSISLERIVRLRGWSNSLDIIKNIFSGSFSELYYAEKTSISSSSMFGGTLFSVVSLLLSPLTFLFTPMYIIFFNKLTLFKKTFGLLEIMLWILTKLSNGTSQGFFIVIVIVAFSFFVKIKRKPFKSKKKSIILTIIFAGIAISLLFAFNLIMSDRTQGYVGFVQKTGISTINYDSWIYNILPDGLKNFSILFDYYICQGYYGLSLGTTLFWNPTFFGASRWFCLEVYDYFPAIYENTYIYRIAQIYPWDPSVNWHSAYLWFANDLSLIGVIPLMYFVGRIFASVYYSAYNTKSPVSIGLFLLLIEMIIFLPCNNLVFSDSHTLFPFILYLLVYFVFKHRKNFKHI